MVSVQESQGFLLQDKEDSIDKLKVFVEVVELERQGEVSSLAIFRGVPRDNPL